MDCQRPVTAYSYPCVGKHQPVAATLISRPIAAGREAGSKELQGISPVVGRRKHAVASGPLFPAKTKFS